MHSKENILSPLFKSKLKAHLLVPSGVNTDVYGSFSGEVKRELSVKTVLRAKARAGMKILGLNHGLSSEGSFGLHPTLPFISCNQESLLFIDDVNEIEIFYNFLSKETSFVYQNIESEKDLLKFLKKINLKEQAVIIKPNSDFEDAAFIHKGLQNLEQIKKAYFKVCSEFSDSSVWIETDNRAHMNLSRRENIYKAGEKLIDILLKLCPECRSPGFSLRDTVPGLKCKLCGVASEFSKEELWSCPKPITACSYEVIKPRSDGLKFLSAADCVYCNS